MMRAGWASSLRIRLLAATVVALSVALLLAGLLLASLFRQQVERQFQSTLQLQLDQLTASIEFSPEGTPQPKLQALSDPRWQQPYSGLYWQIDGPTQPGALRSRSLWDAALNLPIDTLSNGSVHAHLGIGPLAARLLMLERTVHPADQPERSWRLMVAADTRSLEEAVQHFGGMLTASLALLLLLLVLAALAQVYVGLRPLRTLESAVNDVREGRSQRLQGEFPTEIQTLTNDFNLVLERHAKVVERARHHAGNLAHAVKTPLAVLAQAAAQDKNGPLAHLVQEQVQLATRHIDWHLARARASGAQRLPGQRTAVTPVLSRLVRVMERVHAARELVIQSNAVLGDTTTPASQTAPQFAGEEQDLHEILGNLIDNACKWAHHTVHVSLSMLPAPGNLPASLRVCIEDDGPGIETSLRHQMLARGQRADESVPGSGLGLAIVWDLVTLYGGSLELGPSALGGLKVDVLLPAVK
jgi:signal transduction histidine kinase